MQTETGKTARLNLVADPAIKQRLEAIAKRERRSVSSCILLAIDAWLDAHEPKAQAS